VIDGPSAGFAGAIDSWGEVPEGGRSPPPGSSCVDVDARTRALVRGWAHSEPLAGAAAR